MHSNAVAFSAELDQVLLNVLEFSELWIIDHSTTSAEAAGHTGGKHGKGGDLIYRWGNPRAYRAGTVKDQKLFGQLLRTGFPTAILARATCSYLTTEAAASAAALVG